MDLAALEEIRRLKYRYLRCVDLKLWDEIADVFTARRHARTTARWRSASRSGCAAGTRSSPSCATSSGPDIITVHFASQPEIDVDGAAATGTWCFEDTVIATEYRVLIKGAAFYEDRYARGEDGRWRISHTGYSRIYEVMMSLDDAAELLEVHREPLGRQRGRRAHSRGTPVEPAAAVIDAFRTCSTLVGPVLRGCPAGRERPERLPCSPSRSRTRWSRPRRSSQARRTSRPSRTSPRGTTTWPGSIRASLQLAWAYQRDFPYFVQSTGPYTKLGLDNPDTLYLHAYLRDDAEYVVTGQPRHDRRPELPGAERRLLTRRGAGQPDRV